MVKKLQCRPWNIIKDGHSEDDTFHTTSKTPENFKRVIFIMKVLHWNWLKWRGKSVPKEWCGYFSHLFDVYEVSPEQSL